MDSFGRYKIVRQVGMGAFANVYEAIDPVLDRRVAVKVARAHPDSPDYESPVVRFRTEATVLRRLEHPSIAKVFEMNTLEDGTSYLVMEWIQDRSLEQILQAGQRIPLDEALFIAEQVASALGAAHAAGFLLHSDVKPSNIFIDDAGLKHSPRVILSDFGLAGSSGATSMTQAGTVVGTPFYMAQANSRTGAFPQL